MFSFSITQPPFLLTSDILFPAIFIWEHCINNPLFLFSVRQIQSHCLWLTYHFWKGNYGNGPNYIQHLTTTFGPTDFFMAANGSEVEQIFVSWDTKHVAYLQRKHWIKQNLAPSHSFSQSLYLRCLGCRKISFFPMHFSTWQKIPC